MCIRKAKTEKMDQTPQTKKVEKAISPTAQGMGYEIVRVLMVGAGSGKPTLQIMAEKPDGTMNLDDCSRLSQAISAVLDVENVMDGAYYLEVSSPGIDRPLTRLKDFERYKGLEAKVELDTAINGQKKFKGKLLGANGDTVNLQTEEGPVQALPFGHIQKAKLVLTDELIKSAQQKKG
ncbi:MAG: ribosome maturation factor RimP [Alphaproteobacteria bacterium]